LKEELDYDKYRISAVKEHGDFKIYTKKHLSEKDLAGYLKWIEKNANRFDEDGYIIKSRPEDLEGEWE
jgi:hypothetical protein